uniref:NADAR domain-containing protein n=1 Tax=Caenorhabditis japonica TaxID=281687 RepID=A0A8R1DXX9_CAEJA
MLANTRVHISKGNGPNLVLFWEDDSPFSNFNPANFQVRDHEKLLEFRFSEQYFMYQKSIFANDPLSAEKVLKADEPLKMKKIGRALKMSREDLDRWSTVSRDVMYRACLEKFSQSEPHRLSLFRTHGMNLVEASPFDKVWGIGLSKDDQRAENPETWMGTNWLGQVLNRVREELWERNEFRVDREKVEAEDLKTRVHFVENF